MQQIPGGARQAIANLRRQIDSGTLPPDTAEDFKRRIAYYECRIAIEGNAGAPAPPAKAAPAPSVDPLARSGPIPSQTPGAWFVIGGGGAKAIPMVARKSTHEAMPSVATSGRRIETQHSA
jgi:hypothetical protein